MCRSPAIRYFVDCPWLARALVDLHPELGLLMHLDHHVADLVSLVVSQENSCRFCYAAVRAMLCIQGMSEARIQRIEAGPDAGRSAGTDRGGHRLRAEPVALRSGGSGAHASEALAPRGVRSGRDEGDRVRGRQHATS